MADYFRHFSYHSGVVAGAFCPISSCSAVLKSYDNLRSHLFRHHRKRPHEADVDFLCPLPLLAAKTVDMAYTFWISGFKYDTLITHVEIKCPSKGAMKPDTSLFVCCNNNDTNFNLTINVSIREHRGSIGDSLATVPGTRTFSHTLWSLSNITGKKHGCVKLMLFLALLGHST